MTLADRLTFARIILSPVFFMVYFYAPGRGPVTTAVLWLLFAAIEFSDLLDGMVARKSNSVSSFGKLFDPFADVFARITYFVCFAFSGVMPLWAFLVILYREFGILFLRLLLAVRGIAMGARPGGKAKAVVYMGAGAVSLYSVTSGLAGVPAGNAGTLQWVLSAFYVAAVILAVASFMDYLVQYRRLISSDSASKRPVLTGKSDPMH